MISSTAIEDSLCFVEGCSVAVFDSVQSFTAEDGGGFPGTPSQVRAVAQKIIEDQGRVGAVGHWPHKQGSMLAEAAGAHGGRGLVHRRSSPCSLRSYKNRFGSTDELGVFEMKTGLSQSRTKPPLLEFRRDRLGRRHGESWRFEALCRRGAGTGGPHALPYPKRTARGSTPGGSSSCWPSWTGCAYPPARRLRECRQALSVKDPTPAWHSARSPRRR